MPNRTLLIAGNWKMNNDRKAAKELIGELTPMVKDAACEVVLCVPYTNLETALSLCEGTNLHVGAENCHWAKSGASASVLTSTHSHSLSCPSESGQAKVM